MEERTMKFISLISRGPGQDRAAFQHWFIREHAPTVLERVRRLDHYVVNVNDVTPNMGVAPLDSAPVPYDVVTEMWVQPTRASQTAAELYQATSGSAAVQEHLRSDGASSHAYLVAETVEKDQQQFALG